MTGQLLHVQYFTIQGNDCSDFKAVADSNSMYDVIRSSDTLVLFNDLCLHVAHIARRAVVGATSMI